MIKLLKTYTIEVTIQEGNDELWDEIRAKGGSCADEIVGHIADALTQNGFIIPDCHVRLIRFEERGPLGPRPQ